MKVYIKKSLNKKGCVKKEACKITNVNQSFLRENLSYFALVDKQSAV